MDNEKRLSGKTIAILVANGFTEIEMTDIQKVIVAEGGRTKIVSHEIGIANGWMDDTWGHNFFVDIKPSDVLPSQYDGLLVPGGRRHVTSLLGNAHARRIIKGMLELGKAVALVAEAVELLVPSQVAAGRTAAATTPALVEKLAAAGASIGDETVVTDGPLLTAASTADVPALTTAFINAMVEGGAEARAAA